MKNNNLSKNDNYSSYCDYLKQKFASERTILNYLSFVESSLVLRYLKKIANKDSIYKVEDFDILLKLYLAIKDDKDNIRLHRIYSSAVSKYIKFMFPNIKLRQLY